VEISDSALGLALVLVFFMVGFAFTFSFWRYEALSEMASIELEVPLDDAVAKCMRAMSASRLRSIEVLTGPIPSVSGHTRPSIRSLGTHCSIEINQAGGGTLLVCRCRPRPELVLTDWGARRSVLQTLVERIAAEGRSVTPADRVDSLGRAYSEDGIAAG
jgi:hypothetical protein